MSEKVINVSLSFECPFNGGGMCVLDDNIAFQLECMGIDDAGGIIEEIPAECPLHKSDYTIRLVK